MKHHILYFLLSFFFTSGILNAQNEKGKFIIGASSSILLGGSNSIGINSFGYTRTKITTNNPIVQTIVSEETGINVSTELARFITDNLAMGLSIMAGYSVNKDDIGNKRKRSVFGVGPFMRYYLPIKKALPYLEVNSNFGSNNTNFNTPVGIDGLTRFTSGFSSFGGGIGSNIFLGDKVAIDISLDYRSLRFRVEDSEDNTTVGSIGMNVGFNVFL